MANEIEQLVAERDKTHGKYERTADAAQHLKSVMHSKDGWSNLDPTQKEALDMFASKIGRILGGNPDFVDHWLDISGYSQLVIDRLSGRR